MPKKTRPEKKKDGALLSKILDKYNVSAKFPGASSGKITFSREYKIFKKEEALSRKKTVYEKLCDSSERILKIMPDSSMQIKLDAAIKFTGLNATPTGVASFAVLAGVALFFISALSFALPIPFIFKLIFVMAAIIAGYLLYTYPINLANIFRVESGSDVVMSVLYMTIFMKSNPTLEGALRFAANNVSGKVGKDFKKILWEVESGRYSTVEDGLNNYLMEWKEYNKEFVESILIIRESMLESSISRREALLDKAIDIILIGTDEKMKKYARDLETPIMVLEGLGILLPVMGMIVFPLLTIFLAEEMRDIGIYLAMGYTVILPAIVYFFMNRTLEQRPATHTKIDISKHPDYVAGNNISVRFLGKSASIPAFPLAASITLLLMVPGINYITATDFFSKGEHGIFSMLMSMSIVFALALGVAVYNYAASFQKIGLRRKVSQIENEFEDALFALGSRIGGGTPIEAAISAAERDTKELEISDMFRILLKNINRLSMTFKAALFDEKYGALQYYPSALIITVMKAVSESVEKGSRAASMSMLTISRYLRDIRSTQERIEDLLSSIIASLKFQSFILIPVMSAVVVAVAQLIIQILINLGAQFSILQGTLPSGTGAGLSIGSIFPTESAVASETLQLIVGVYVVELLAIMGIFITRIEFGHDEIEEHNTVWKLVVFGIIIYVIVLLLVMAVFTPLIAAISKGMGAG